MSIDERRVRSSAEFNERLPDDVFEGHVLRALSH
jgi:hypothetical protein